MWLGGGGGGEGGESQGRSNKLEQKAVSSLTVLTSYVIGSGNKRLCGEGRAREEVIS
jgi:hypothetical protein